MKIKYLPNADHELSNSESTGRLLKQVADGIKPRVKMPKEDGYELMTFGGRSRRGAFAQLVLRGPRAIFVEFGTKTKAAQAPLRRAVFRGR